MLVVCEFMIKGESYFLRFMGSVLLFICIASCMLYSDKPGVKSVHIVLSVLKLKLFDCVHVYIPCSHSYYPCDVGVY